MGERGKAAGDLRKAIREVRTALADQNDVVVELREAEQARLTILADSLSGLLETGTSGADHFSLAVLPGDPPRLWVDATSFVMMGRDKRTYQFVKETRLGRTVLAESSSHESLADAVTRYVAERMVEREQALEADWVTAMMRTGRANGAGRLVNASEKPGLLILAGFGFGILAGMALLLAIAWVMVG